MASIVLLLAAICAIGVVYHLRRGDPLTAWVYGGGAIAFLLIVVAFRRRT